MKAVQGLLEGGNRVLSLYPEREVHIEFDPLPY